MITHEKIIELKQFANDIRRSAMLAMGKFGIGHVGGCMSIADAFAVLYNGVMQLRPNDPSWPDRDKIIMSKGHAGPIMYAALAQRGFFPGAWLDTLNVGGTKLPSHTDRLFTPGVDMSTGSLGQGASTASGFALADRIQGRKAHTFLILGDGELNEGQVWEAMMFIADKKLTNLITIIDNNKMQVDGLNADVCDMGDLKGKFEAFGLDARFVEDGNDVEQLWNAFEAALQQSDRPICLILNTVKGKDAKGFENNFAFHHTGITPEQLDTVLKHLDQIDENLAKERYA